MKMIKKILNLKIDLKERLFILTRYFSNPFIEIASYIDGYKNILDIGCGHGLLELVIMEKGISGTILGVDPDQKKIKLAKKIFSKSKKVKFVATTLENLQVKHKFDCVAVVDVDYLLNNSQKNQLLKRIKKILKKNGKLLIKTVVKTKTPGYYLGYLQEIITVLLWKKTLSSNTSFYFMSQKDYLLLLKQNDFNVINNKPLKGLLYHPHHLFIAQLKN